MAPPQLSGNTPVADIHEPVQIDLVKSLRHKCEIPVLNGLDRRLRHLLHRDEPLLLDHRFNGRVAAVMRADSMCMRDDFHKEPKLFKISDDLPSGFIAVHPRVLSAEPVHRSVVIQDIDLREIMTFSDLKVIRVMRRCDLHAARSEFHVDVLIRDHRDLSAREREQEHLADDICIALIIGVDRDCGIPKHCLRTRCRNLDKSSFLSDNRIIDVPEESVLILMLDFRV